MDTLAVVLEAPERLDLKHLPLTDPQGDDLVVDVVWSGISTGTERLLYTGQMPTFPGMGYPLVPGYESVGRVVQASAATNAKPGDMVFVPGARCFGPVRGLFGGAASRLIVPAARTTMIDSDWGQDAVLLALAATARHALAAPNAALPDLIVGHGVLGRLLARLTVALGGEPPTVWESNAARRTGTLAYPVVDPSSDERRDYRSIYDVSGDAMVLDKLVQRLAPTGEIVLAGFYAAPLSLSFPPAFMREARFRVAAEWKQPDLDATVDLLRAGRLSLADLITHAAPASEAVDAYRTAFADPACLKMILDWSACS
ncbi:chlorophyll synthesis pathway protein BchC [Lichenifustis flavocetrariae]|uniref:Chlorophyll synthesis pathway protein BchC n=1 Tax=Lichenifustis flavocetrariae TaxID=2949735 RepID=A0AA41YSC6_9HYPH|nr:chlorophyll synthesis pathway protein BchC [Lichenifustis flavocetrariae]MCW6507284.1 chlorophyll synthesis pathway protein BchC [Lichenifustis flavocetrariae]